MCNGLALLGRIPAIALPNLEGNGARTHWRFKLSDVEAWMKKAKEHPGSWWPDWLTWIKSQSDETVPAP